MKKLKLQITIVLVLLMVYAPITTIAHFILCSHEQEVLSLNSIEKVTAYELHHDCSDFIFKLSSFSYNFEQVLTAIKTQIYTCDLAIYVSSHTTYYNLINALRGPPNPILNLLTILKKNS